MSDPLDFPCPFCGADTGQPCTYDQGRKLLTRDRKGGGRHHAARIERAEEGLGWEAPPAG